MVSGPADKRVHLTLPTVPVAAPLTLAAVRGAASWGSTTSTTRRAPSTAASTAAPRPRPRDAL